MTSQNPRKTAHFEFFLSGAPPAYDKVRLRPLLEEKIQTALSCVSPVYGIHINSNEVASLLLATCYLLLPNGVRP